MYKINYSFSMNIMLEILEIRSCTEISVNYIKIYTVNVLQLIKNYKVYILGDLHHLKDKSALDMYDLS